MTDIKLCCGCKKKPRASSEAYCRECRNAKQREWNLSNTGLSWQKYRLTKEDLYCMWLFQGGRCFICPNVISMYKPRGFHIDHDLKCCPRKSNGYNKTCGECVRGLLCSNCNRGLGHFQDNPVILRNAAKYIELTKNN